MILSAQNAPVFIEMHNKLSTSTTGNKKVSSKASKIKIGGLHKKTISLAPGGSSKVSLGTIKD